MDFISVSLAGSSPAREMTAQAVPCPRTVGAGTPDDRKLLSRNSEHDNPPVSRPVRNRLRVSAAPDTPDRFTRHLS
jgi:hypothetical protein